MGEEAGLVRSETQSRAGRDDVTGHRALAVYERASGLRAGGNLGVGFTASSACRSPYSRIIRRARDDSRTASPMAATCARNRICRACCSVSVYRGTVVLTVEANVPCYLSFLPIQLLILFFRS